MNDETEKAIRDSFYSGYRSGYRAGKQEEYKKYSAKLNKIMAAYHKEREAAWNRWEDSDDLSVQRMQRKV